MNTMKILAIIILILLLCNRYIVNDDNLLNHPKKPKERHSLDLDKSLQLVALLILTILLLYLWLGGQGLVTRILLILSSIIYAVVFIVAIGTVGALVMSKGNSKLSEDEKQSLQLIGLCVSVFGLIRPDHFAVGTNEELSITSCLVTAADYSIHLFLIGTLALGPLQKGADFIITCADKVKHKYIATLNRITKILNSPKRKHVISTSVYSKWKISKGWLRVLFTIALVFSLPYDLVAYILTYAVRGFILVPLALIGKLLMRFGQHLLKIMNWLKKLSHRQLAVISFRTALIVGILIVDISIQSKPSAAFEFISSVVIIPILFEWICAAIFQNKQ